MKNPKLLGRERNGFLPKIDLNVKITLFFLMSALFQLQAGSDYGNDISIDLIEKEATVLEIITAIESQTEYKFFYSKEELDLERKVDIRVKKQGIEKILKKLFPFGEISYKIIEKQIVLTPNTNLSIIDTTSSNATDVQDFEVYGTVSDANGAALPGASILLKGTGNGTTSDFDGNYSITVPGNNAVLVFSYIGFTPKEIAVNGQSTINIVLEESSQALDEVVVTALGIERDRKTLGYATAKVDSEEFAVNRTPNFMDALQGKVAGVNISGLGAGPQGSSKIRIRGISSFGNNNSPLIVVNGVPINNTSFGVRGDVGEVGSNRRSDSGDGLSSINPDDVETMTILKGAAASALYGSRAKDGVIMITTKSRSEEGGVEVSLNSNYTNGTPLDYTDYQFEYGQGEGGERPDAPFPNTGVWSFGEPVGGTQILFDGLVVPYLPQRNKVSDYYRNSSTLMNTISVASGGDNGGISFSAANMDATSILPGSDYTRRTVNVGFTQKLKKFTISGNINYSNEERTNPPNIAEQDFSPVVIYTLASTLPLDLLRENCCDENGDEIPYSRFTNRTNPYFALKRFENNTRDRVFGNITTSYVFTDWLSAQLRVGQDYYMRDVDYNLPTGSQRQSDPPPGFVNGQYIQDQRRFREINADFLITANKQFGEFGTMLNVGGNQMYRRSDVNTILGENFYTRDLYTIGNASTVSPNYIRSEEQINSLYAAAEISYGGYLYVNATARNDWFSTLSPANRSILYPSVTGSFVFSQAFKMPSWFSFGKIRVAYAEVGSDTDVGPYADNLPYRINPLQLLNQPVGGIDTSVIPNTDLRPMRVTEREVGLELTLFNNLRFEASYYNKLSSDQILLAQTSDASGYTTRRINVGESRNEGVEVFLGVSPIKTDNFTWNTSANLSYNTSEVLSLGESVDDNFITVGEAEFHGELRQVVGKPMAQLYGWGWLRDNQGNQIFDENNGFPLRSEEQINFGSALPKWVGGFTNSFKYKNLTASFLIDYKLGHKMISGTHINAYRHGLDKATLVGRDVGYVIGEGVNLDGSVNTARADIQGFYQTIRTHRGSEASVFNAGSWQLRQISIGYDFSNHLERFKVIKGLKFDIVANNVAVLKKWVPHIHPDQNGIIGDQFVGLEATGLPITREIGFNMNIKF